MIGPCGDYLGPGRRGGSGEVIGQRDGRGDVLNTRSRPNRQEADGIVQRCHCQAPPRWNWVEYSGGENRAEKRTKEIIMYGVWNSLGSLGTPNPIRAEKAVPPPSEKLDLSPVSNPRGKLGCDTTSQERYQANQRLD